MQTNNQDTSKQSALSEADRAREEGEVASNDNQTMDPIQEALARVTLSDLAKGASSAELTLNPKPADVDDISSDNFDIGKALNGAMMELFEIQRGAARLIEHAAKSNTKEKRGEGNKRGNMATEENTAEEGTEVDDKKE